MKINDLFLDLMGECYRAMCGVNDVLILDGRIVTFEAFLQRIAAHREQRQCAA